LLLGSALLSELLQQFSAGRQSSIEDFVFDVVGISLAGLFVFFVQRMWGVVPARVYLNCEL